MHSLGIQFATHGPNDWMIETSWTQMANAERLFLTKGTPHWAKENATNALVNVYDWLSPDADCNEAVHQWSGGFVEVSLPPAEWQLQCFECSAEDCPMGEPRCFRRE